MSAEAPAAAAPAVEELTTVEAVAVPVEGALLATDVVRPARAGAYPTLLIRTPYDRRALRDVLAVVDPLAAARRGWVVAMQDTRGRFDSTGRFSFLRHDGADGAATIAWIARQPWSDGRVAMGGRSYLGRVQELAASAGAPALRAIAPETCGSSRETWHPGGVLQLVVAAGWVVRLAAAAGVAVDADDPIAIVRRLADPHDEVSHLAGALRPWVLDRVSPHWAQVEPSQAALARIPALRTTGWYDSQLTTTVARHRDGQARGASGAHKLVIGPWGHVALDARFPGADHGPNASAEALGLDRLRERFYAAAIDGRPAEEIPNAHVFVTGRDAWALLDAWPPPTRERAWFLAADANGGEDGPAPAPRALRAAPAAERSAGRFVGDPHNPVPDLGVSREDVGPVDRRELGERRDVLVYRSAPLERELTVAGWGRVELFVESEARDFDIMVRVWDAHPGGAEVRLADGVANRAALGEVDRASGLVTLRIPLSPCHHVVHAGHALVLTVQSNEYPRYLPNPQTGRRLADGAPFAGRVARHAVHEGEPAPSRLVLPCAGPW